jgi:PilZ domain
VTITSLTRSKPIRIYDVSAGGCLLESREPLPVGTVGLLTMDFDGRRRQEWIRVCRVQADESRRGPCLVSVEFLPLEPAGAESLRGAVLRLRAVGTRSHFPTPSGRSSGDPGKSMEWDNEQRVSSSPVAPADHEDLNSSCISLELATPLLNSPVRACPKPEKE